MRLHRFFVNQPIEFTITVVEDERLIHQWRDVFRYNIGSEIIIFDGCGVEYDAVIEKMTNREAKLRLISERQGLVPNQKIILCQSLIKKDRMEWVVEKATELGISKIVPILSERSEKKGFNTGRARKIAIEASEQCGRADIPEIMEIMDLVSGFKSYGDDALVFDQSSHSTSLPLKGKRKIDPVVSVFIGPEGGWSDKELEMFKKEKARVFSLGPFTLRAETAVIAGLARLCIF